MSVAGVRESVAVARAPASLQPAFACAVLRTVAAASPPAPLFARVQANPYACLNVVTAGQVSIGERPLPQAFLVGPLSAPLETCAPGALRSVSLVFAPWLLEPLFGIRAAHAANRIVDVAGLAHPLLARWCEHAARVDATDPARLAFWSALAAGLPEAAAAQPQLAFDVLRSEGVESAAARAGCSSRQYRRRFERHMGIAPATWLRVTRWEEALRHIAAAQGAEIPFGELAALAGFADQAHMSRETRAFAAESPARLRAALREGKASWSLRPARDRSVQDGK